jgi:hypothetical protein
VNGCAAKPDRKRTAPAAVGTSQELTAQEAQAARLARDGQVPPSGPDARAPVSSEVEFLVRPVDGNASVPAARS